MSAVPDIISKTSCPQQWQVPPRTHGIVPRPLTEVKFVKPKPVTEVKSEQCVCSTLYNPINTSFPDVDFLNGLKHILPLHGNIQMLQVLPDTFDGLQTKMTAFGSVLEGSTLSHQLPEPQSDGTITRIEDAPSFPALPLNTCELSCTLHTVLNENEQLFLDSLKLTQTQAEEIEELTRRQSECPEWHKLRQKRLTSSKFKDIVVRKKDFDTLVDRLTSTRKVQTVAMKHGIDSESNAVLEYSVHKNVNIKPCGFLVNPSAPFLGSSPDRLVYDPNESNLFGVLEMKCPMKDSYKECQFLKEVDGTYTLRKSHAYYLQIIGQMAISGLTWGDFCVWTQSDMHIERIYFESDVWADTFEKLSLFYFDHFMKKFV